MFKVRKTVSATQEVNSTRNIQLGFSSIVQRADKDYSSSILWSYLEHPHKVSRKIKFFISIYPFFESIF